jgi:ketosteroid isomerase-like protein
MSARDVEWREMAHARNQLLAAERTYVWTRSQKGAAQALAKVGADDIRVLREDRMPAGGPAAAAAEIALGPRDQTLLPLGDRVASSLDLGYSYGLIVGRAGSAARPDTVAYAHFWRRGADGRWKLVVDVENPYPKR